MVSTCSNTVLLTDGSVILEHHCTRIRSSSNGPYPMRWFPASIIDSEGSTFKHFRTVSGHTSSAAHSVVPVRLSLCLYAWAMIFWKKIPTRTGPEIQDRIGFKTWTSLCKISQKPTYDWKRREHTECCIWFCVLWWVREGSQNLRRSRMYFLRSYYRTIFVIKNILILFRTISKILTHTFICSKQHIGSFIL